MNRIYYVRHGENPANLTKEFSCRLVDYSLTEKGVLQAQQTAEYFRDKEIHAIYSSPLKRALETAAILGQELHLPITILEELREVNVGTLELMGGSAESWALHRQIVLDWFRGKTETCFPEGENYLGLWARTRAAFERIEAENQNRNVVVVAHGGMLWTTIRELCENVTVAQLQENQGNNCSITEILLSWRDGQPQGELVRLATYGHLYGEAANLVSGLPSSEERDLSRGPLSS